MIPSQSLAYVVAPNLIDFTPEPFGSFSSSYSLTQAKDVVLVPTMGHTAGHLSVIVNDGSESTILRGDTSYTQQLLLDGVVDGVLSKDDQQEMCLPAAQVDPNSQPFVDVG